MNNRLVGIPLIIGLLVLGACSNVGFVEQQESWLVPGDGLEIKQWKLQGRLLIRTEDILNVNINWRHNGTKDELSLFGVLGLGRKKIEIDGRSIILDNGDGKKISSNDVDGFIAQQLGFVVPITALRHWVLGWPISDEPMIRVKDGFEQLGWKIKSSRFKKTEIGMMPHKLKISKDKIKLTLIIDRWER